MNCRSPFPFIDDIDDMARYIDLQCYKERRIEFPEIMRLGIPVLMALDALLEGELETSEVREKTCPDRKNLMSTTAISALESHGLIKATKKQTQNPRRGAGIVQYLELTPKGRKALTGLFVDISYNE